MLERMLGRVVALPPLAVFAVMARTVGTQGFSALSGPAAYLGVVVLGLTIQVGPVYQSPVVFVARAPLRAFWGRSARRRPARPGPAAAWRRSP